MSGELVSLYTSKERIKAQIGKTADNLNTQLDQMILDASRAIDRFTNRPDGYVALTTAAAREYTGSGTPIQRIEECVSITKVEVKDSPTDSAYVEWAANDYIPFTGDATRPDFNRTPYTGLMVDPSGIQSYFVSGRITTLRGFPTEFNARIRGAPTVRVTAKWGYATEAPGSIEQACIIQVSRWIKRALSGWADTLGNAEFGLLMYQKVLDPEVQYLLQDGRWIVPAV